MELSAFLSAHEFLNSVNLLDRMMGYEYRKR